MRHCRGILFSKRTLISIIDLLVHAHNMHLCFINHIPVSEMLEINKLHCI